MKLEIKLKGFTAKLAENKEELTKAQILRYNGLLLKFDNTSTTGIDATEEDEYCDHLIVVENATQRVVGNYRLLTYDIVSKLNVPFICEHSFDVTKLKQIAQQGYGILEIGRAVVDPQYRDQPIITLLWKALFEYCKQKNIRYMFGTASYQVEPYDEANITNFAYANSFAYLYHNYLAEDKLDCPANFGGINLKKVADAMGDYDVVKGKQETPSLIRYYMQLGAKVASDACIDLTTTIPSIDVFVVSDLHNITPFMRRLLGV